LEFLDRHLGIARYLAAEIGMVLCISGDIYRIREEYEGESKDRMRKGVKLCLMPLVLPLVLAIVIGAAAPERQQLGWASLVRCKRRWSSIESLNDDERKALLKKTPAKSWSADLPATSHFFIDYLPKGTYVFEYSARVQHKGEYQSGMALIECMYAPEFNSHSESFALKVE
jgi:hypothetical protein